MIVRQLVTQLNTLCAITLIMISVGCGGSSDQAETLPPIDEGSLDITIPDNIFTSNPQGDISYQTLSNRDPDCASYAGNYTATIIDQQQSVILSSYLEITTDEEYCTFTSNNIPQHDVGANTTTGASFATMVTPNTLPYVVKIKRHPVKTSQATYVQKVASHLTLNGIMLNGVDLDVDSAFCYHPDFTTENQIGLGTRDQCGLFADWYAIPARNPQNVVLDEYTGHAFDGRYHYHGDNHALSEVEEGDILQAANLTSEAGSPVIGFAPDGFPIYGHYFFDVGTGEQRKAKSSWRTYTTERETPEGSEIQAPSIATHPRGMFVEDWYYEEGFGDLDECNGMTDAYGNYAYYYTEDYPYGPVCSFGEPDPSFTKINTEYDDGGAND
ncbi:MAG: YHYH protein [Kangiellaceae bacterium]|nr:YHYH protein [Kangiellaceae bacterium]MCW9018111.1 YHYH protein [Kangiellaceae bacterium]